MERLNSKGSMTSEKRYNSIMHDLFIGHVSKWERPASYNDACKELECEIKRDVEYLESKLSGDATFRFDGYRMKQLRLNRMEEIENFSHDFKLGALFMMELLSVEKVPALDED